MTRHAIGILALLWACVAATGAEEPKFSGGDGSSCEEAVIPMASAGTTVVQAEYHWLRMMFGGGAPVRQTLGASTDGKRRYDLILWRKPDGQTVDICFDVTTVFEEEIRRVEEQEDGGPRSPAR